MLYAAHFFWGIGWFQPPCFMQLLIFFLQKILFLDAFMLFIFFFDLVGVIFSIKLLSDQYID